MTKHTCVWRSSEGWRRDLEWPDGWRAQRRARVRTCQECRVEEVTLWLGRRQRGLMAPLSDTIPDELKELFGGRGWLPATALLTRTKGHRLMLDEKLRDWLEAGWVDVEERASGYPPIWMIEKARLSPFLADHLYARPKRERAERLAAEMCALLDKMAGWQADAEQGRELWQDNEQMTGLIDRLAQIAAAQEAAMQAGSWVALPDLPQRLGDAPHRRWIALLRGLLAHVASGQWQYERAFAAVWLGDSKELAGERAEIARYLGLEHLSDIALFPHTPVVLCWGRFAASCHGHPVDGEAGVPFVALSALTVRTATDWAIAADAVLVIENQTAFETALRPPLLDQRALYLFSGGHAGMAERELLKRWLTARPDLLWYVWTDWDPGGVRIQADWQRWAEEQTLSAPHAWLWHEDLFDRWRERGRELSETQQQALLRMNSPLAAWLLKQGLWWEQEAVLGYLAALGRPALDAGEIASRGVAALS
jgi:hypothetical protein